MSAPGTAGAPPGLSDEERAGPPQLQGRPTAETAPIVQVEGLTVDFFGGANSSFSKPVRAVSNVNLTLLPGEVLALLGESGSGKSVTLRALMRLLPERRAVIGGRIRVDGRDVRALSNRDLSGYRGRSIAMIFQEPGLAFDPVYRVGDQIAEAVMRHERLSRRQARARALDLFERVRIPSAARRLDSYPHEMSGGMRQRAMIALALACRPKVLLADEPTTALDATVQIQVLLLLRELQRELGLAVIFVTHDIGVATEIADRIAVMYAGRIVETGSCRDVIRAAAHPYTAGLLAFRSGHAAAKGARLPAIPGAPPDMANLPAGCAFAPRCAQARPGCELGAPPDVAVGPDHRAKCFLLTVAP
jgi:peptide/nickel transport system ATP-binding protein